MCPADFPPPPPALVRPAASLDLPMTRHAQAVEGLERELASEATLSLQPGAESRLFVHKDRPALGTLIMFHGFTAGTWQFVPLAELAYAAGYDVYIPRLPGHGLRDRQGVEDQEAHYRQSS